MNSAPNSFEIKLVILNISHNAIHAIERKIKNITLKPINAFIIKSFIRPKIKE